MDRGTDYGRWQSCSIREWETNVPRFLGNTKTVSDFLSSPALEEADQFGESPLIPLPGAAGEQWLIRRSIHHPLLFANAETGQLGLPV